jgi:uncharacterized membrane protein
MSEVVGPVTAVSLRAHRSQLPTWGIPLLYAAGAVLVGLTLPRFETTVFPGLSAQVTPPVAITIYSTVGSGMLAFTGIVFSLTFVMVQFSATAYSPRLVLWVARDPVISHAIGIFTATFLYSIAALSWVDRSGSGTVLVFSLGVVAVLLLGSIGMFVALIQRVARLQVNYMLAFTGAQGRRVIETMYPPLDAPIENADPAQFSGAAITQTVQYRGQPQSLQTIRLTRLLALAERSGGAVQVMSCVGDTLVEGRTILRVLGGTQPVAGREWSKAFEAGDERTFEQDPKYAIRLLVDIAIKALSPAINDPTTAVQTLDQIEDLLRRLGRKRLEIGAFRDNARRLRLVIQYPSWTDLLSLGLEEIRLCGATSIQVMRRMEAMIADLMATLPPERQAALQYCQERLDSTIARSFADDADKREASVEDRQGLGAPRERPRHP